MKFDRYRSKLGISLELRAKLVFRKIVRTECYRTTHHLHWSPLR